MNPERQPERLRAIGERALWLLVIGLAVAGLLYVAARLRLVVLPTLLALVMATLLEPPNLWLRRRGWPPGAAALAVVASGLAAVGGLLAAVAPQAADQFGELDVQVTGGIDELRRSLVESPLPISDEDVSEALDTLRDEVANNLSDIGLGALTGATLLLEILAALALSFVLLFFFLKDGERIWSWLCGLAPPERRAMAQRVGRRSWEALSGFLRGQTIVAVFDAVLIGLALVIVGVPLVLPLVVLTFFGAYVPILGATIAGLAAVLVALVSDGVGAALIVLAAIVAVQQLEGNVLQPVVVGRSVHVHPIAILLGVTAGAVLGGVIGAMVAAPVVAVLAAVLDTLREPAAGEREAAAPAQAAPDP